MIPDVADLTVLFSSGEEIFSTDSRYTLNTTGFTHTISGTEKDKNQVDWSLFRDLRTTPLPISQLTLQTNQQPPGDQD